MPATQNSAQATVRTRASAKYGQLSPLEAALIDEQRESNDAVVAAVNRVADSTDRLTSRAPHPAVVWGIGAMLFVYGITLIAGGRGVDVTAAAEAAKIVLSASPTTTTTTTTETTIEAPVVAVHPEAAKVAADEDAAEAPGTPGVE